ncbi:MAG TPA: hypothetical protein VLJ88_04125 [Propionibacteriaceae bacterium]|nr:hypothetical protein [Propionibacteriaceae bacterium]
MTGISASPKGMRMPLTARGRSALPRAVSGMTGMSGLAAVGRES